MPYRFSQKLREKLKAYFLERHGVEISGEQADEYLDSMADLYCALSAPNAQRNPPDAKRPGRPRAFSS
jgi:hypothetical protein